MEISRWRELPLASKFTLVFISMLSLTIILITAVSILREWQVFQEDLQEQAKVVLDLLAVTAKDQLIEKDTQAIQATLTAFVKANEHVTLARVYNQKGRILGDGLHPENRYTRISTDFESGLLEAPTIVFDFQTSKEIRAGYALISQDQTIGAIAIGLSRQPLTRKVGQLALQGLLTAFLIAFVGGAVVFTISRTMIQPIEDLADATTRIAQGDFSHKIEIDTEDEIGKLAQAFNSMSAQLEETLSTLETRIAERTNELSVRSTELEMANIKNQRRAVQFETISQIVNSVRAIRSLDELLPRIAELISERFGFYHAGIFINDARSQFAVLKAANSPGGKNMLARGHNLKIGQQGIVGTVAAKGEPRIAMDVGEDAVYFDNPDLPTTRSELALPLRSDSEIIGVLDVQSEQEAVFDDEDVYVLSILADQVSIAIENTRLYDETQKSLVEAETLYRQYLRQAWSRLPKEQRLEGYQYTVGGAKPIKPEEVKKTNSKKLMQEVAIPISLRGEALGTLAVQIPNTETVSADQMDVIKAVADRVAISIENARLFDETTKRAERERIVSEITTKIRSKNDPDQMIQIALDELKSALGATQAQLIPHSVQKNDQPASVMKTPSDPEEDTGEKLA